MALSIPLSETADVEETLATPTGDYYSLSDHREGGPGESRVLLEQDALLSREDLLKELAKERRRNLEMTRELRQLKRRHSTLPVGLLNQQCSELTRIVDALKHESDTLHDQWRQQLKEFSVDAYSDVMHSVVRLDVEMNDKLEITQRNLDDFRLRAELCERIAHETERMTNLIGRMKTRKLPGVLLRDEKVHHRWQIAMWMRHTFRSFFGAAKLNHTGFFVDTALTTIIHRYSFEVPYLRGNDILGGATVPSKLKKLPGVLLSDEKKNLIEMVIWTRNTFRRFFGFAKFYECGDLIDNHFSRIIHGYGCGLNYAIKGHQSAVYASVMSEDGCYLYTASQDRTVIIWDLTQHEKIGVWTAHDSWISCITYQCGLVVTGSQDTTIRIWNAFTQELVRQLDGHSDLVRCVSFNDMDKDDGLSKLVSASRDKTVRIWAVKTGKCLRVLRGHTGFVRAAYFIGDKIISGGYDRFIRVWHPDLKPDAVTEECVEEFNVGTEIKVTDLAVNCNQTVVACTTERGIYFYQWPDMTLLQEIDDGAHRGWFHPTHPDVFAAGVASNWNVKVWNIRQAKLMHDFEGHTDGCSKGCFTPDGTLMASVSSDSTVRIWDVGPDRSKELIQSIGL